MDFPSNPHLFIFFTFILLEPVSSLSITACDCESPVVKGIMDVSDPFYCSNLTIDSYTRIPKILSYQILKKPLPNLSWEGYACTQWIEKKTVIGSFWIGSYDTTFSHETKLVESAECWAMVNYRKCGDCPMTENDNILACIRKPTGDGAWYATREYPILNCQVQKITFSQDKPGDPIFTPFGPIQINKNAQSFHLNHHTLVWLTPETLPDPMCRTTSAFKGWGKVSIIKNEGHLLDPNNQLEIIFNLPNVILCSNRTVFIYSILNMPEIFLQLSENVELLAKRRFKRQLSELTIGEVETKTKITPNSLEIPATQMNSTYFWGGIVNQIENEPLCLTEPSLYEKLTLRECVVGNGIISRAQNFELHLDFTIRRHPTKNCLSANNFEARLYPCNNSSPIWEIDPLTNQIMHQNTECLGTFDGEIKLENCSKLTKQNKLIFKFSNQNFKTNTAAKIVANSTNYSLNTSKRARRNKKELPSELLRKWWIYWEVRHFTLDSQ